MSVNSIELYSAYPAIFDAHTIPDVISVTPSAAVQKMVATPSGSLNPALIAEVSRDPTAMLSALSIGSILSWLSANNGLAVAAATFQYQARADGGAFQGAGNHVTVTSPKGFLAPESIRAQQDEQQPTALAMKYWGLTDGVNEPMIVNTAQNLTGSPGVANIYKLGPVVIDGETLEWVQSSQVNFGIDYFTKRGSGYRAPGVGSIRSRKPTAEIGGDNLAIAAITNMGLALVETALTFYFLDANAAPDDAAHISITFGPGTTYESTEVQAQGDGDAETRLAITGVGTLTVSTTATHPDA